MILDIFCCCNQLFPSSPLDMLMKTHLPLRRGNVQSPLLISVSSFFFAAVCISPEEYMDFISLSMIGVDLYLM